MSRTILMPVLKNQRHERYAQELAKGNSAISAYKTAGYKPDRGAATRLSAKVSGRVSELKAVAAGKAEVTIATIAMQLDDDRSFAREQGQAGAAVSATMGKAKLFGLLKEDAGNALTINGNINVTRIERIIVDPVEPPELVDVGDTNR